MNKSPISALQELMAVQHLPLPIYVEDDVSCQSSDFVCTVMVCGIKVKGHGRTKKDAKHASAEAALVQLISATEQPKTNPMHGQCLRNFVGELNEMASQSGLPYPTYHVDGYTKIGELIVSCHFQEKTAHGYGRNKKAGKQHAAKTMIDTMGPLSKLVPPTPLPNQSHNDDDVREVVERFKKFSAIEVTHKKQEFKDSLSTANVSFENHECLNKRVQELGIVCNITRFQEHPPIVVITVAKGQHVFMGCGKTYEMARDNAFKSLLDSHSFGLPLV